ncbi:unnamed protein product, partial [Prorocentrum cordatum]
FAGTLWQHKSIITKLEMELAETKARLAKAEGEDQDSMDMEDGAPGVDDAQKKLERIATIDDSLLRIKDLQETAFMQLRSQLEDERAKRQDEALAQIQKQMELLREKLAEQQKIIQDAESELLEVNAEQSRLADTVPQAPENAQPSTPASGLGVTVEKLGSLLQELGDDGAVKGQLGAATQGLQALDQAKKERYRAAREAAAAGLAAGGLHGPAAHGDGAASAGAGPAGSGPVDDRPTGPKVQVADFMAEDVDVDQIKAFIEGMGATPAGDMTAIRAQYERQRDLMLANLAGEAQKKSRSAEWFHDVATRIAVLLLMTERLKMQTRSPPALLSRASFTLGQAGRALAMSGLGQELLAEATRGQVITANISDGKQFMSFLP